MGFVLLACFEDHLSDFQCWKKVWLKCQIFDNQSVLAPVALMPCLSWKSVQGKEDGKSEQVNRACCVGEKKSCWVQIKIMSGSCVCIVPTKACNVPRQSNNLVSCRYMSNHKLFELIIFYFNFIKLYFVMILIGNMKD